MFDIDKLYRTVDELEYASEASWWTISRVARFFNIEEMELLYFFQFIYQGRSYGIYQHELRVNPISMRIIAERILANEVNGLVGHVLNRDELESMADDII